QLTSLLGELVRFEVSNGAYSLRGATLQEAEAFWSSRTPQRFVPAFDSSLTGIPSFDELGFTDSIRVGAKAANLAELSRLLGDQAPRAGLAIPFHYYEEFMNTSSTSVELCDRAAAACAESGRDMDACGQARALCITGGAETFTEFLHRLLDDASFNQDTVLRDALLANVRYFIEHTPVSWQFAELLDGRVATVFGPARIKIRSSTNTEDLPGFSGAGLYNSHRAYATGSEAASRVVTKVFASTWSFRAFEERSFWNIDHGSVRMGCVLNEAFSDELANGVLVTQNVANPSIYGMYVNVQVGEESVTNPSQGALPEIFAILGDTGYQVSRERFSSLSPGEPILSDGEVASLYDAGEQTHAHFAKLYGRDTVLEIEFKLTPEHQIVFKQARPYTDDR
ncbi:MAG TPA: PEP/pyruvate-binding domain-containing protein, partial [Polyangiaceae bacterium]